MRMMTMTMMTMMMMMIIVIGRLKLQKKTTKCHPPGRDPQNATRWPHDDSDTLQDAPKTPQDD